MPKCKCRFVIPSHVGAVWFHGQNEVRSTYSPDRTAGLSGFSKVGESSLLITDSGGIQEETT